ncbi:MAG: terminase small subunit [Paracoccus sp. (in: a-proteobacteria)]|nr:terminase small subunit [Paracoccus sp. (in: a-proteobacteria)]
MSIKSKLTAKQAAFAREFVVDNNATQAAIRAGYSRKTAGSQGHELLRLPHVKAEIDRLTAEKIARTEIRTDEIVMALSQIARANISDLMEWGSTEVIMDADGNMRAVQEGETATTVVPFVRAFESGAIPRHLTAAIAEISLSDKGSFKIKMHDKLGAIDKLMRHLGMFEEDNKQAVDGLSALIAAAQGSALRPATSSADEDGDE